MKSLVGILALALLLNSSIGSESDPQATAAPQVMTQVTPGVIVRGWEIQSVLGVRRPTVTRIVPDYKQRKRVGVIREASKPRRGGFLIVQVQTQWATAQPPNEPLWAGRPAVSLLDSEGVEYPAIDALMPQAADLVVDGMAAESARSRAKVLETSSAVWTYFDVPSGARAFWLRLSKDGPLLPVTEVNNLPKVESSSAN